MSSRSRKTEPASPSDQHLLERLGAGDDRAMQQLFQRHREFVFRIALGNCDCREDAVDIVQDVFLALLQGAATLHLKDARLTTWLYRVTRNRCIDRFRRNPPASESNANVVESHLGDGPEIRLLELERNQLLQQAVARLPARPREVFVLRIGLGLATAEVAALIGIQAGAVRVALTKAKTMLRETLGNRRRVS